MTPATASEQLVTAFADPQTRTWGVAVGTDPFVVCDLSGAELEHALTFEPGRAVGLTGTEALGELQPGWVTGGIGTDGSATEVRVPALRVVAAAGRRPASRRILGAWMLDGRSLGLVADRQGRSKGHDRDRIEVALDLAPAVAPVLAADAEHEDEHDGADAPTTVFDPRLSTTYGAGDAIRSFGVELWLGHDPDGDQRPSRYGGHALGAPAPATAGVTVQPMLVRSGDVEGLGIYALVSGR